MTVGMFLQDIERYIPMKVANPLSFSIASQDVILTRQVLLSNVRCKYLLLKYCAPEAGSVYTFRAPEFSEDVAVLAGATLRTLSADLCRHLAPKLCLASAFTFQFWRRPLDLDHPFLDFGLPVGTEISVSLDNALDVIVQWPSDEQKLVVVGARDRVSDLRAFLAVAKGCNASGVLLRAEDAELEDIRPLSELRWDCLQLPHAPLHFRHGGDFPTRPPLMQQLASPRCSRLMRRRRPDAPAG
jgi:hypothetical protein